MKRIVDWLFSGVVEEDRLWWTKAWVFFLGYVWVMLTLVILDYYDLLP